MNYESVAYTESNDGSVQLADGVSVRDMDGPRLAPSVAKSAFTIVVASTFTADLLREPLQFWMERMDLAGTISMAPYAQALQELLNPESSLSTNRHGFNVLLVRLEDCLGEVSKESTALGQQHIFRVVDDFATAVAVLRARVSIPILILLCAPSPALPPALRLAFQDGERALAARLNAIANVHCGTHANLIRLYPVRQHADAHADRIAHIPYTYEYFVAAATLLARRIAALVKPSYKVIAVDCDNTLWKGICGEDGAAGVQLTAVHLQLQRMLVRQHDAGMLLCLCSKNNAADVHAVFRSHPQMPLREEHLISSRINWNPKSSNLASLAQELGLSLESFIMLDDSEVECGEVRAHCSSVLTLQFPRTAKASKHFLRHIWAFDHVGVTEEAKQRTLQYVQNRARTKALEDTADFAKFLAHLQLQINVTSMGHGQLVRTAELIQRTNQFNLTGIRRDGGELERLWKLGEVEGLVVHVADRYGDYGLVGAILLRRLATGIDVDTFVVSCRALSRGVEHRMVNTLGRIALDAGLPNVVLRFARTPRNPPAQAFLERNFEQFREPGGGSEAGVEQAVFCVPAEYAESLRHDPAVRPAGTNDESPTGRSTPASTSSIQLYEAACRLSRVPDIVDEINRRKATVFCASEQYLAPRTELESTLAGIWSEVLGLPRVGIRDDFLEIGGDSLSAVRVIAKMEAALGLDFSLPELIEASTVEQAAFRLTHASLYGATLTPDELAPIAPYDGLDSTEAAHPLRPRTKSDLPPLTALQLRTWRGLSEQKAGRNERLCVVATRVIGDLDADLLAECLATVVHRHESLRTRIVLVDGVPRQQIDAPHDGHLTLVDLSGPHSASTDSAAMRIAQEFLKERVDLSIGPLFAAKLLRLSRREHMLLLATEHLISDGLSDSVLHREVWTTYKQTTQGTPSTLPPLPLQFADYAIWQQRTYESWRQQHEGYWKRRLIAAPQVQVPVDTGRAETDPPLGAMLHFPLGHAASDKLYELARKERTFPALVVLTLYAAIMSSWCSRRDLVVRFAVHGRHRPELDDMIGLLASYLHLRIEVNKNDTFLTLLRRVHQEFRFAHRHQDFGRVPDFIPTCNSELTFNWLPRRTWRIANVGPKAGPVVKVEPLPLEITWPVKFDTRCSVGREGIDVAVMYRPDLFAANTVRRFGDAMTASAHAIARDPLARAVPLETAEARFVR